MIVRRAAAIRVSRHVLGDTGLDGKKMDRTTTRFRVSQAARAD
jgi:hypothetical protein